MALPTTISTVAGAPNRNYRLGPFKAPNGAFYVVLALDADGSPAVFKASDPEGGSWSEQDAANNPTGSGVISLAAEIDGTTIHIASFQNANPEIQYHAFGTTADTWSVVDEEVDNLPQVPAAAARAVDIAIRSDGDVIVLYSGDTDNDMGTQYDRCDYARREGGTWTAGVDVGGTSPAAEDRMPGKIVVGSGDNHHLFWYNSTAGEISGRTLGGDNALSTTRTASLTTQLHPFGSGVSYDDSGTQRVIVPYGDQTNGPVYVWRFTEDGSGDLAASPVSTQLSDASNDVRWANDSPVLVSALDTDDGDRMYVLWVEDTTNDIQRDSATPPQSSWSTDVEVKAGNYNRLDGAIYIRTTNWRLAYIHNEGSSVVYDEVQLGAAASDISIDVNDTITLTDFLTLAITPLIIDQADSVSVVDDLTLAITPLLINEADAITSTDVLTLAITPLVIDVVETIAVAENLWFAVGGLIVLAPSANIAASGENTTAQLAAPSGKTTADFDAGRIQDDENPADAVDITLDDYTELEWSIKSTDDIELDTQYEFRVTANGAALDTYTVTPQLSFSSELVIDVSDVVALVDATTVTLTVGEITINVSEAITAADVLTLAITPLLIDVADAISIADIAQLSITPLLIDVSETVTSVDALTLAITPLLIDVSETITAAEALTLAITPLLINVSDDLSIVDDLTLAITPLQVDVSDSISISDVLTLAITPLLVDVFESLSIADIATLDIVGDIVIDVADSVSITDVLTLVITPLLIDVSESVSSADALTLAITPLQVDVGETITAADVLTLAITPLLVNVADAITSTDALTLAITPLQIDAADTITSTDALTLAITPLLVDVADSLSVADTAIVDVAGDILIDVADSVTVIESLTLAITPLLIDVSDSITIAEAETLAITPLLIDVADSVSVAENMWIAVGGLIVLALSDNIAASGENTTVQLLAPSGKTTADFDAGRIQDDENPTDAVDITADDYTELEWSIKSTDDIELDTQYEFRVTASGTALDTYTVTPQLSFSSELVIDVSDVIAIAESATVDVFLPGQIAIDVSESVSIADALTLAITPLLIDVADTVTSSDFLTLAITPLLIDLAETISIVDAETIALTDNNITINVFEIVRVVDVDQQLAITRLGPAGVPMAAQRFLVVELVDAHISINVADAISLADVLTLAITPLLVDVSESVSIVDALALAITPLEIDVSDAISITDVLTLAITPLLVDVAEVLSLVDATTVTLADVGTITVNVSESISVAEALTLAITPLLVDVSDSVSIADSLTLAITPLLLNVSESVTIVDASIVSLAADIAIDVAEALTVADAATLAITPLTISVSDAVVVADALTLLITPIVISVSDAVTVTDALTLAVTPLLVNVSDTLSVADALTLSITPLVINVFETLTVVESVDADTGIPVPAVAERSFFVPAEDRFFKVKAEDRFFKVKFESRFFVARR